MTLGFFLSTQTIDGWLASYGYLVVFLLVMIERIGVPVPGETALIGAALYAGSTGKLEIEWVIVAAIAGAIPRSIRCGAWCRLIPAWIG